MKEEIGDVPKIEGLVHGLLKCIFFISISSSKFKIGSCLEGLLVALISTLFENTQI